jgi:hypothetical protein
MTRSTLEAIRRFGETYQMFSNCVTLVSSSLVLIVHWCSVANCCWSSLAQSFLFLSPAGPTTISHCLTTRELCSFDLTWCATTQNYIPQKHLMTSNPARYATILTSAIWSMYLVGILLHEFLGWERVRLVMRLSRNRDPLVGNPGGCHHNFSFQETSSIPYGGAWTVPCHILL